MSKDDEEGFDPEALQNLQAFNSLQRQIAAIDLSAIHAVQRAVESSLSSVNIEAFFTTYRR